MKKDSSATNAPKPGYSKDHAMAVLLIHGVGEQKPMQTLMGFVSAMKRCLEHGDDNPLKSIELYYKPDPLSGNYETRILRLCYPGTGKRIDFYEFYWANLMKDTKKSDFLGWVLQLLFCPWRLSRTLRKTWWGLWGIIAAVSLAAGAVYRLGTAGYAWAAWCVGFASLVLIPLLRYFYDYLLVHYVGDAGRYFTPSPANIDVRYNIRKKGLEILRTLHSRKRYSQIVVVGHSLGSVIGYDLLRLLWPEFNDANELIRKNEAEAEDRAEFERAKQKANDDLEKLNKFATNKEQMSPERFQQLQAECLRSQQAIGQQWLISDFITIGSPLKHFDSVTPKELSLESSVSMREFPSCPPIVDEKGQKFYYEDEFKDIRTIHHAGVFALTRWSNIYFRNDPVGGSANKEFQNFIIPVDSDGFRYDQKSAGPGGVRDIELESKHPWYKFGGHTKYWSDCLCIGCEKNYKRKNGSESIPANCNCCSKCESAGCGRSPAQICREMRLREFLETPVK